MYFPPMLRESPRARPRLSGLRLAVLLLASAAALALCPSAGAATTIGSPLSIAPEHSSCGSGTFTNTALADSLTAPFTGVIVRWRMALQEAGGANLYKLRVLRPAGGTKYTGVGTGPAQTAPLAGINVLDLSTPLPVQAGDIIAVDCPNGAPSPSTDHGLATSTYAYFNPLLGEGKTASTNNQLPGDEVLINADVVGSPSLTSISPASGPASGGTVVTLTGSHLGEVSAVTFGSTSATFTLDSETQLSAIVPPGDGGTAAGISVTNAAGSATAPQTFVYEGAPPASSPGSGPAPALASPPPPPPLQCVVPKLKGKKLKAGKKMLAKAHCKLGKVTKEGTTAKTGKVVKQKPKAGTTRVPDSKVNVVLGR